MKSVVVFFFQAEDGIRDLVRSRGLGDVYKRQEWCGSCRWRGDWTWVVDGGETKLGDGGTGVDLQGLSLIHI